MTEDFLYGIFLILAFFLLYSIIYQIVRVNQHNEEYQELIKGLTRDIVEHITKIEMLHRSFNKIDKRQSALNKELKKCKELVKQCEERGKDD